MSATDAGFAGSIPTLYERHLGPLLFAPFAEDLAARLRDIPGGLILETAAGTGILTRALALALPPSIWIVATDLNQTMLDVAATLLRAERISWRQADAQQLPLEDSSFEAVVCQFGVMFFPDKQAGYREARRVLKPGGRFIFNVWDSLAANEVTRVISDAVAAAFPGDPPRFFERTPFAYFDEAAIRADLEAAGFRRTDVERIEKVTTARSADSVARGMCQGTPLRTEIEARAPGRLEEITARAAEALVARFGSTSFENRMRALVVTASP